MSQTFNQALFLTLTISISSVQVVECEVPSAVPGAYISRASGDVKNGAGEPLAAGTRLVDGDTVTAGRNSWVEVKWKSSIVRAWQATSFQIQPSRNCIALRQGNIRFFVSKTRPDNEPYEICTPHHRAVVGGTTISVMVTAAKEQISTFDDPVSVYDLRTNALIKSIQPGVAWCYPD